jgi:hypothetical protein
MTTIETLTAAFETARITYFAALTARGRAFGPTLYPAECALKAAEVALKTARLALEAATPVAAPVAAAFAAPTARRLTAAAHYRHDRAAHCEGSDDISYG